MTFTVNVLPSCILWGVLAMKTYLYFIFECRNSANLFSTPVGLKTCLSLTCIERA